MTKRIALITTKEGVVSGVTVFMKLMKEELQKRGFEVEFIRPIAHSFQNLPTISSILGYGMAREELKKFDLVMGNGIGLTGAVDLPIKVIDNIHSTASGANRAISYGIDTLTELEKEWLDRILPSLVGETRADLKKSLTVRENAFEVDKIAAQKSDAIVTVSYSTREEVLDFFGVEDKLVKVVPNGVEENWFGPREFDPLVTLNDVNVIYTGRAGYTPINILWKGFDRILAVLSSVKNAQPIGIFHLGVSDKRVEYEHLLFEAGIPYRLDIENKDLAHFLRAGDIYIQTSRYEACSLSLMEAMASGLAPVTFPSGMSEVQIHNGENGYIVHSIEEMKERIQYLINNPELRIKMGRAAAHTMRKDYSVEKMVNGYVEVINELLS